MPSSGKKKRRQQQLEERKKQREEAKQQQSQQQQEQTTEITQQESQSSTQSQQPVQQTARQSVSQQVPQQPALQQQAPQHQVPRQQAPRQQTRRQQTPQQQAPPQQAPPQQTPQQQQPWGSQQLSPHQQGPQQSGAQQQAWGPRQQQPWGSQQLAPQQQGPQQSVAQQQPWGPQQIAPQQQGPQQSVTQQQAWGPRQQQPRGSQQIAPQQQGPQQSVAQQQAWGPRQQQAWGPRQLAPQQQGPQQSVAQQQPWGPRQIAPQQQGPQQSVAQQQAWGLRQQQQQQQRPQQPPPSPQGPSPAQQQASQYQDDPQKQIMPSMERMTTSSSSSLGSGDKKELKKISEVDLHIPHRPNPTRAGTIGRRITVLTNMFEMKFADNFVTNATHYDVQITPKASKAIFRQVFETFRKGYFADRYPAFDGNKNAYSANDLPFDDILQVKITIPDPQRAEEKTYEIKLQKVATVDLTWVKNLKPGINDADINPTSVQVLDIVIRHMAMNQYWVAGRSVFPPVKPERYLGGGLDVQVGSFSSALPGWKFYLNVDVSHKAFVKPQEVIELINELLRGKLNDQRALNMNKQKIEKFLTGVKVNYTVINPNQPNRKRTYRINGLGPSARQHRFLVNGAMRTIEEYFAMDKNHKLTWPNLPCLWVGSKQKEEKTYLPLELCTIEPGQVVNRKLDDKQTSEMIKVAASSTEERKQKVMNAFHSIDVNKSPVVKEFRFSVNAEMKEVEARELPAPQIQYSTRKMPVRKGVWYASKFNQAMHLEDGTWTIINMATENLTARLSSFEGLLCKTGEGLGMKIGRLRQLPRPDCLNPQDMDIRRIFNENKQLKLIIVVLPDYPDVIYAKVKKISEMEVGVLTQCIKLKNVVSPQPATIQNILLKINSKLNGINHTLAKETIPFCLRDTYCMLVGADVTHPPPEAQHLPSVAAVAASHNESAFQYNVVVTVQPPKMEIILHLEEIINKQIQKYVKETSKIPKRIIFYRDGVSEGQLAQVIDREIKAIISACEKYRRGYRPEITFLVVQKRHHIRFFPKNPQDSDDRNGNVRAGTIVDKEITHPNHIDFYLVSHASIKGTARPTKYRCICNESRFTEDQIEELTYYLCHMYARCTRSVSYPAPTYYAHLAAYRGKMWIQEKQYTEEDYQDTKKYNLNPVLTEAPMCFV